MDTIIFKVENQGDVKVPAQRGDNIMELAQKAGVQIDVPCSGNGTCGKCRVRLISGGLDVEKNMKLSEEDYEDGWRLACQSRVNSDAVIWVPASAGAFKSDIQTADLSSEEELKTYENALEEVFASGLSRGCTETCYGIAIDIGTTTVTGAMLDLATGDVMAKTSLGNGQIRYGADVINRIIQQGKTGGREKLQKAVRGRLLCLL